MALTQKATFKYEETIFISSNLLNAIQSCMGLKIFSNIVSSINVCVEIKKHVPNFITCCNLMCGMLAIINIGYGSIVVATIFILLALLFDFFDGFAARALNAHTVIGKDLDSLADMVTFGVVPGLLMVYQFKSQHAFNSDKEGYIALLIPVFSALRLAKFNNDARQKDSFIGLPTPANTLLITSLVLLAQVSETVSQTHLLPAGNTVAIYFSRVVTHVFSNSILYSLCCGISAFLLVAEIPMFSFKFKNYGWRSNKIRFIFIALSAVLLLWLYLAAVPVILFLYILLSFINEKLSSKRK